MPGRRDDHDATAPTIAGAPATSPTLAAPGGAAPATAAVIGDLARYHVGALLGRGGMGEVRLARDERIGRDVAVKFLLADGAPSADAVSRFLREARVQGRLDHPAVVPVHDLGVDDRGVPYFAMKRLAGTTLAAILDSHARGDLDAPVRWPRRLLVTRLAEICLAVHFAHTRGVVHRDLKPHNIQLGDFGEVYVLDWGIAKVADDELPAGPGIQRGDLATLDSVAGATAAGAVLGTPGYMAPEQLRGGLIDHRVDVYALGCILFEILALESALPRGAAAFDPGVVAAPLRPAARRPEAEIPPELDDACARATAPDHRDRFDSARDLHDAIQRYLDGDRDLARRRELAAGHALAAERALDDAGDAARAGAMREAGRALALDPTNQAAAALIGRMLLEPPTQLPAEIQAAIDRDRVRTGTAQLQIGTWAYLSYLLFLPWLLWIGVRSWALVAVIAVLALGNAFLTWAAGRTPDGVGRWLYLAITTDVALLVASAALFSPLVLVPSMVIGATVAFLTQPMTRSALPVLGGSLVALVLPLVLEWTGVLPSTFGFENGALVIRPWALDSEPRAILALVVSGTLFTVAAAGAIVMRLRAAQDAAERRMHLLAWHLGKLVPETPAGNQPGS